MTAGSEEDTHIELLPIIGNKTHGIESRTVERLGLHV